jgi:alkylation response protein AidB-like acyl-CoA dehydrogenase
VSAVRRHLFDDEHHLFRESAATFVAREIVPIQEEVRSGRAIPRELWLRAGAQGLLGLSVPSRYGGSGVADFRFNAILQEELAKAGMAYASSIGIHGDTVAPYLVDLATERQRDAWLPRFVSGELVTAIAMTEPQAGSDLGAIRTTARQVGGDWVINGSKTFITNGLSADLVVVAARTGSGATSTSITLFAVLGDTPGFVRGRKLEKVGQPEADTSELFFEDVVVGSENVIGEPGRGFVHMMERLPQERLSAACANVGHTQMALDATLAYVKERRAFGKPIGSFQHSRFVLAELVTELEVTQAYIDRCLVAQVAGELSSSDAAKAKWWSAEVQNRVIDRCVQLFGGYGYMLEYDIARAWADARVTKIWAGSNEIMKELIARSLGLSESLS